MLYAFSEDGTMLLKTSDAPAVSWCWKHAVVSYTLIIPQNDTGNHVCLTPRVSVLKNKVSTQNYNYDSAYRTHTYSAFGYFRPLEYTTILE